MSNVAIFDFVFFVLYNSLLEFGKFPFAISVVLFSFLIFFLSNISLILIVVVLVFCSIFVHLYYKIQSHLYLIIFPILFHISCVLLNC